MFFCAIMFGIVFCFLFIAICNSKKELQGIWFYKPVVKQYVFLKRLPVSVFACSAFFIGYSSSLFFWKIHFQVFDLLIKIGWFLAGTLFLIGVLVVFFINLVYKPCVGAIKNRNAKEFLYLGFQLCPYTKKYDHLWVWEMGLNNTKKYFLVYSNCEKTLKISNSILDELNEINKSEPIYEVVEKIRRDVKDKFKDISAGILPKMQIKLEDKNIVDTFYKGIVEYVVADNTSEDEAIVKSIIYKEVYNIASTIKVKK